MDAQSAIRLQIGGMFIQIAMLEERVARLQAELAQRPAPEPREESQTPPSE